MTYRYDITYLPIPGPDASAWEWDRYLRALLDYIAGAIS